MSDQQKDLSKDSEKMLYVQQGLAPLGLVRLGLASPEQIRSFSYGEVKNSRTINLKTNKPEDDGLFCCKIFGPIKAWQCNCGKYTGYGNRGIVCDKCGVECAHPKVRYQRMGHIKLAIPIVHCWCFKWIIDLLKISLDNLKKVIYYEAYIITSVRDCPLSEATVLSPIDYLELLKQYGMRFDAERGSAAIKKLLGRLNLDELFEDLSRGSQEGYESKQLDVIQWFRKSNSRPEWMVLEVLPVIPPIVTPIKSFKR